MTQLSADNETIKGPLAGLALTQALTILDAEKMYAGGLMAVDYAGEAQMASDTLGLRVIGICSENVDNSDDGETVDPPLAGIYRLNNSSTNAVTAAMRGRPCYVEDDNTVASTSTNLVAAGLVHDVDSDGVWVDVRPEALAAARRLARPKVVSITDGTATVTAAQCFQGNVVLACDNATGVTLTLPTAVAGYRVGVQRIAATAAHDVVVTAGAGDKVRGSAAAGTITNDTDAVSDILWLETEDATDWVDAEPLAKDRAEWTASA